MAARCYALTTAGVVALAAAPRLSHLTVNWCQHVSGLAVAWLHDARPTLNIEAKFCGA